MQRRLRITQRHVKSVFFKVFKTACEMNDSVDDVGLYTNKNEAPVTYNFLLSVLFHYILYVQGKKLKKTIHVTGRGGL
jgi:hypothetical protein